MTNSLKLYWRYLDLSLRAQMQYRASFALKASAQFFLTFMEFLGLAALFHRFGQIRGWTLAEMALFYGIISIAFAIAEAGARGFDVFSRFVRMGDFDRVLLRPRSPALQVLGLEFQLMRIGRFTQGLLVLIWAAHHLPINWSLAKTAVVTWSITGGACLFAGLFVIQAALCFWTVEAIELVNCTTYGGVEIAQFPLSIYRGPLRTFFIWIVPLATINYFPAHALLEKPEVMGSSHLFQILAPAAGILFLILATAFWRFGVRHYRSTGS